MIELEKEQKGLILERLDGVLKELKKVNSEYKVKYNRVKKFVSLIDFKDEEDSVSLSSRLVRAYGIDKNVSGIIGPCIVTVFKDENDENFLLMDTSFMKAHYGELTGALVSKNVDFSMPTLVLTAISYVSSMCKTEMNNGVLEIHFESDVSEKEQDDVAEFLSTLLYIIAVNEGKLKYNACQTKGLYNGLEEVTELLKVNFLIDKEKVLSLLENINNYVLVNDALINEVILLVEDNNLRYEQECDRKAKEQEKSYKDLQRLKGPRRLKPASYVDSEPEKRAKETHEKELPDAVQNLVLSYADLILDTPLDDVSTNGFNVYFPYVEDKYLNETKRLMLSLLNEEYELILKTGDKQKCQALATKIIMLEDYEPKNNLSHARKR